MKLISPFLISLLCLTGVQTASSYQGPTVTDTAEPSASDAVVSPLAISPSPDLKVNGSDGPLIISEGSSVQVSASLSPNDQLGQPADWWVYAAGPTGLFWYNTGGGWVPSQTPVLTYSGPLIELSPMTILDTSTIPAGAYTLYFAVDDNQDGVFDAHHLDQVEVSITSDNGCGSLPGNVTLETGIDLANPGGRVTLELVGSNSISSTPVVNSATNPSYSGTFTYAPTTGFSDIGRLVWVSECPGGGSYETTHFSCRATSSQPVLYWKNSESDWQCDMTDPANRYINVQNINCPEGTNCSLYQEVRHNGIPD